MNEVEELNTRLKQILNSKNIGTNELMSKHTSFKVGGPVDILVEPENFQQVKKIIELCNSSGTAYYVIGNGSNLLVKDGGIRGVAIKLTKLNKIIIEDDIITAQSGASFIKVSLEAMKHSLTGLEFACGIPGSIGGALTMNAGAYNGEISTVVESAVVVDKDGVVKTLTKEELELEYRMSSILKYGYTVLEVKLKLVHGEYEKIKGRMNELTKRRKDKQPLEYPSAGSTFKRPNGYFAAKLIEDSGLKGISVGGAEVSQKHSGFVINKGGATSKNIIDLITFIQQTVKKQFDVDLKTEVRILGEDK